MDLKKIEEGVRLILEGIGEDPEREGLVETPERYARMCQQVFGGLTQTPEEHLKKSGTPTMGGIMMLIAMIGILVCFAFKYPVLILPIVLILGYGLVGFIDDRKKLVEKSSDGISAKMKMILLFVFSVAFLVLYMVFLDWGTGTNIKFLDTAGNDYLSGSAVLTLIPSGIRRCELHNIQRVESVTRLAAYGSSDS